MSHHSKSSDRRDGSHHGNSGSSLQKKRERDKMRRQQQYDQQEKAAEPVFLPMRKTSRQDSLTRNISSVLGDMDLAYENLRRQPDSWYFTSRMPVQSSGASSSNPLLGSQRGNGSGSIPSRETMPSLGRPSHPDMANSSGAFRPNEYDSRSTSKSRQQRDSVHDRHGQTYTKVLSDNGKRHRTSPHSKSSAMGQNLSFVGEVNDSRDSCVAGIRKSDRDRVSSVDSDTLRVENILEEMVKIPPSITAIKTPSVSELKNFNFMPSLQKKRGTDNTVDSSGPNTGGLSDDESSDETSEEEKDTDWNLRNFIKEPQSQDSAVHFQSTPSNSNKAASDTDAHNQTYPDSKSFPKRKVHQNSGSDERGPDPQRSVKDDIAPTSSAQTKSRSRSSSSSQLRASPRQRQPGTKDSHSSMKQSKEVTLKRNSVSSLNSSRNDSAIRGSKSKAPPNNCNIDTPELRNNSTKLHRTHEATVFRSSKESGLNKSKSKKKSNSMVPPPAMTNPGSPRSSSSSESSSDESGNADSSEGEDDNHDVFDGHSVKNDNGAMQYSFATSNSPTYHSQKEGRIVSQSDEDNTDCVYEKANATWRNHGKEDLKPLRTNLSSSSHGKNSPSCHYTDKHPHVVSATTVKRDTAQADLPMANIQSVRCSLWVKLKSTLFPSNNGEVVDKRQKASLPDISHEEDAAQAAGRKQRLGMVSTGSETEQPIRRADSVQVAVADGSTDWKGPTINKRKCVFPDQAFDSRSHKRQRREKNRRKQESRSFPVENWKGNVDGHERNVSDGVEHLVDSNEQIRPTSSRMGHESPNSSNLQQRTTVSAAPVVLPDSSVPGEQERMETSDWYMREGKKMKHEGDGMVDSRTGRTRPGEALSRALAYFEASLLFIMSGHVMENENREERFETGSNSSLSTSHSPTNMYQQTLPLLDFVLKMRPHVEQDDRIFKRMTISCLRCQAYLYFRIFKLKKDIAVKNSEILTEQFKTVSKSAQTHSPWRNANAAPNVLSPMSPAVPSPFTHHGPSPASSNGDQVSSSTQAGKVTPSQHANYSLPQKMYDTYRQHHTIMCNLLKAHERWDQGELMMEEHVDFFRNIDALCNRTLTFHSSLRDVYYYYKMVLRQLHALMTSSPST